MAIEALTITTQLPWLVQYDQAASQKLQEVIDRTSSNSSSSLNPLLISLVNAIKAWRSKDKSKSQLEGFLVNAYQGVVMGVTIPNCTDLFDVSGFIPHLKSLSNTFYWANEASSVGGAGVVNEPTNANLVSWIDKITTNAPEISKIESLQESIHTSSSSYVFRSFFNPSGVTPANTSGADRMLIETKAYKKLGILSPSLSLPSF